MVQDLKLAGYAEGTRNEYVRYVKYLSNHFNLSLSQLEDEDIRSFFLYADDVLGWTNPTLKVAHAGISFFCRKTLNREMPALKLFNRKPEKTIPVIFTRSEVDRVLAHVRIPAYRVCLTIIYACGLRLSEGIKLKVVNIDSERMFVHVQRGKGSKDRRVPLPKPILPILRKHWLTHRNKVLLFPSVNRNGGSAGSTDRHIGATTLQTAFHKALLSSGVNKNGSIHTLRHSYATHLIDKGVSLPVVQAYLGHSHLRTTLIYTHLTDDAHKSAVKRIDQLMDGF